MEAFAYLIFAIAEHRARVIWRHFAGAHHARIVGFQFAAHIVVLAVEVALAGFERFLLLHFL